MNSAAPPEPRYDDATEHLPGLLLALAQRLGKPRLKIDFIAPPFAGHLHPILALARCAAQHHQVNVISTLGAQSTICAAELNAISIQAENADACLEHLINPGHAVRSNPLALLRQFRQALTLFQQVRSELDQRYGTQDSAHDNKPDLLIVDFTLPIAGIVAEQHQLLWWTSMPSPCVIETMDGPPAYCGGLKPAQTRWQTWLHALHRLKVRSFKRLVFTLCSPLLRQLGVRQLYRPDGSEAAYSPHCILALADPALEFQRRWPIALTFIGPALYTPPMLCINPQFNAARPCILVTLGTHLQWQKDAVATALQKLAALCPEWDFHFTDGCTAAAQQQLATNLHRYSYVSYQEHLQHYQAVIHHGGAGIMYHCLRHKIPALVWPQDYDQFDHAARLEIAGKATWLRHGLNNAQQVRDLLTRYLQTPKTAVE